MRRPAASDEASIIISIMHVCSYILIVLIHVHLDPSGDRDKTPINSTSDPLDSTTGVGVEVPVPVWVIVLLVIAPLWQAPTIFALHYFLSPFFRLLGSVLDCCTENERGGGWLYKNKSKCVCVYVCTRVLACACVCVCVGGGGGVHVCNSEPHPHLHIEPTHAYGKIVNLCN